MNARGYGGKISIKHDSKLAHMSVARLLTTLRPGIVLLDFHMPGRTAPALAEFWEAAGTKLMAR